ncbi:MAG: DeoR/GlpR family DNA-binding transcription regulator [Spirochaetaceae bacterium]|jgi:DeoR/GlpR family transcriptional regulator of sugar metabolism|nr:DeoR/GlpR family DNA-binding transcription regulator [Spirochaetaceae bacterium]
MFRIERQEKILDYVNRVKNAGNHELAREFGVSNVTIRRDLEALAKKRLLFKTHGGAVSLNNSFLTEIPYSSKEKILTAEKKRIGAAAASLVGTGDIIILDAGSTTLEVARHLAGGDITVLTNDIKIAMELAGKASIHVMVCGGKLESSVYTLTGGTSVDYFKKVHVNRTFLGCDALDIHFGISNRTCEEVEVKLAMLHAGEEVVMVTDHTKLNTKVFFHLCAVELIDRLIIDQIDEKTLSALQKKGIIVTITG